MFPSIRATAEDLIIIISKNKKVIRSELVLKGPEHLYYHNLIWSTYHMPRACRLLSTLFDKGRTRARSSSRRKDREKTAENRLPELRGRRPKKMTSGAHFRGMWMSGKNILVRRVK